MLKKNKTFILEKPQHITAVTIWFPDVQCLENIEVSKTIDLLQKNFDLYFIFSEEIQFVYDLEKYSRLYQAKGYTISQDSDQCQAIWWTLKYLRVLTTAYVGYYSLEADKFEEVTDNLKELIRISNSPINIGIIKYSRVTYDEILNYCKMPEKSNFIITVKYFGSDPRAMYRTHKAVNNILYLRPWLIDKINDFMTGNVDYTETPGTLFLDSFSGFSFNDFFVSWAVKTLIPEKHILNLDLKDAKA